MNIIITRPRDDAEKLAERIAVRGHRPIVMPLIDIVPRPAINVPHLQWQALCLTSANGIAAVPSYFDRDIPVLCVGPHSAAAAAAQGFSNVRRHGGDVDGLVEFVRQICGPDEGPILYLSGAITSGDLAGKLTAHGFSVTRLVAYDAVAIVPKDFAGLLSSAHAVVLYSQRTAQLWQSAVTTANASEKAATITTLCLSQLVASRLPQSWHMRVAETPDEAGMLGLIDRLS